MRGIGALCQRCKGQQLSKHLRSPLCTAHAAGCTQGFHSASSVLDATAEGEENDARSGRGSQLLMLGSYAVSSGFPGPRLAAASERAEASEGGRQLYMQGGVATSGADQGSTSSSEESSSGSEDLRLELLEAALRHVKSKGWSVEAIQQAAQDLRLSPAAAGLFNRPQAELVKFFVDRCNRELAEKLRRHSADLQGLRPSERIRTAVKWRLEMLIPYMDTWPQALAIHTSPGSLPTAVRQVGEVADEIWHAAGDASMDINWYTKRAVLAGVYSSTEAYMLTDYSPGYADTWEALDRRLEDVAALGKLTGRAREAATDALKNVGSLIQWAQNHFAGGGRPGPP